MNTIDSSTSELWKRINATCLSEARLTDLSDFKSSDVNFRIAPWDPRTNGVRYLKTLIYNLCSELTPAQLSRLAAIKNRQLGQPISIQYEGLTICMDYLQALYETEFIAARMPLTGSSVLEIGAGYGRTCHALLSCFPLAAYTIVDLPNCLELSRRYLAAVLPPGEYKKITFKSPVDFFGGGRPGYDLALNIDSFAEMEADTVTAYLGGIAEQCRYFYVKNPVGKYRDPELTAAADSEEMAIALSMGLLREVVDIHDNRAVAAQSSKFVAAYRPGAAWDVLAAAWARPWSYYWQALYENRSGKDVKKE